MELKVIFFSIEVCWWRELHGNKNPFEVYQSLSTFLIVIRHDIDEKLYFISEVMINL
jgi:hypothetical protein